MAAGICIYIIVIGNPDSDNLDNPDQILRFTIRIGGSMLTLYLSILFGVIALILFYLATRQRRQAGIPAGQIIYTDTSQWGKVEKPLFDPQLRLAGRPDYLVKQKGQIIPIEVKSRQAPQVPYDSHIYQLAAYCLLVKHEYGTRPSSGIIHYANRTFAIDFTAKLEESTQATIREMQGRIYESQVDRSHQDAKRCQHCGYRSICDQALGYN
jgi:CRISPR-associated exonuclease Cas4